MTNEKKAAKIVRDILRDLTDRRGLKYEWDSIDADTKKEIRDEWKRIALAVIEKEN